MPPLAPHALRVEHRNRPLNIETPRPRLQWRLEGDGMQSAYQILAASSAEALARDEAGLWDSGRVETDAMETRFEAGPLPAGTDVHWKVRVWDAGGAVGPWSERAFWSNGLREQMRDWGGALWVGLEPDNPRNWLADEDVNGIVSPLGWRAERPDASMGVAPTPALRKEFIVERTVVRARVHASAMGLYELYVNGRRVGDDVLTPGWTDYNRRVLYQTYDVTGLVRAGANAWGAQLGHGWYSGTFAWESGVPSPYGSTPLFIARLELTYDDGTTEAVLTSRDWKAAFGPVRSDLYQGEEYDARAELGDWASPGYDDGAWQPVNRWHNRDTVRLRAHPGAPVRRMHELTPRDIRKLDSGTWLVDLGQNMVGWVRIRVTGPAGHCITLRFAEMLNDDGTPYYTNLRNARCVDRYTCKGGGEEVWEPRFTFHGFRYVEVVDWPGELTAESLTGVVVYSGMDATGEFECSNPMLNQLQHNIVWGQRGNLLEVPTDCPQRDERLGWMGDAQVFVRTACFNMDAAAFYTKWMEDVVEAQSAEGAFTDVAPRMTHRGESAPGWADAGVIVPWAVWQTCGDTRIIDTHFDAMRNWVDFVDARNPDHLWRRNTGASFSDWLNIDAPTPIDIVGSAYFRLSSRLVAEMAAATGRDREAAHYAALSDAVRDAFVAAYVDDEGHVENRTQTAYCMALEFDLLPEALQPKALAHLVADIESRGGHLSTGFLGCPILLFALSNHGALDTAYQLLENETYPSWGYSIRHGATTMWERWDGWTENKGFQTPTMNSFNHYAFGAVGDWMYRVAAGINPAEPGYRRVLFAPRPGGTLTHVRAAHDSVRGRIASEWRIDGGRFQLQVDVPANTRATVRMPVSGDEHEVAPGTHTFDEERT